MPDDRLGDLVADCNVRRQRGHRVLEYHADAGAAHPVEIGRSATDQFGKPETRASLHAPVQGEEEQHLVPERLELARQGGRHVAQSSRLGEGRDFRRDEQDPHDLTIVQC